MMGLSKIAFLVFTITQTFHFSQATRCMEEVNYHEDYSYGFDIRCENLHSQNVNELQFINVYNAIKLTIFNSNITIETKLFNNIPRIREIVITSSVLTFENNNGTTSFSNLEYLEILNLSSNSLKKIPSYAFKSLKNLKGLILSNNFLNKIETDTFKDLSSLETLDLSNNTFKNLNEIPLCEISNLKTLRLPNNHLEDISSSCLTSMDSIETLDLKFNKIKHLPNFSHFRFIINIFLENNEIEDLDTSLSSVRSLQHLNLQNNKLQRLTEKNLKEMKNLATLNLGNNSITEITDTTFSHNPGLLSLNLENNRLFSLRVGNMSSLEELVVSHNRFTNIVQNDLKNVKKLKTLHLSNCSIENIEKNSFKEMNKLELLDLSYNSLQLYDKLFDGLKELKTLDLRNNSLNNLPTNLFQDTPKLKLLDMSHNRLVKLSDIEFSKLKTLEKLNLSFNALIDIDEAILKPLIGLKIIDLERNQLTSIDYEFILQELFNLRTLNVKGNKFSCEFLSKMITFFHQKSVKYTVHTAKTQDEENVGGIHCQENMLQPMNKTLSHAESILVNDSTVLKEIYSITKDDSAKMNVWLLTIILLVCLLFIIIGILSYRLYFFIKRRNYISEEFELLEGKP
ncbi:leucine-rich repeat-containing protein 15-like [Agrilus planipennis]|uniref:Leucine-rich repeat-containing protein 15-like n=1 Tax=Agrilus planipennis TaxID=224129 RepID=A0A1W4XIK0_AGRPL|nr:leucine-rich repeat-containing protein 15-like [Agrilus planipennis]